MTKFKKGESGNPQGRPPGTRSKSSEDIRAFLLKFLENNLDSLQETYDKLDAKDKVRLLSVVFRYTMTLPFNPENLSVENLEQILNYLKHEQKQKSIIVSN